MLSTSFGRASGPLEGRVGGDVFRFSVAGSQSETLTGEVTVSGDEMESLITFPASGAVRQTGKFPYAEPHRLRALDPESLMRVAFTGPSTVGDSDCGSEGGEMIRLNPGSDLSLVDLIAPPGRLPAENRGVRGGMLFSLDSPGGLPPTSSP